MNVNVELAVRINEVDIQNNNVTRWGNTTRNKFANYFMSDAGKSEWQNKYFYKFLNY